MIPLNRIFIGLSLLLMIAATQPAPAYAQESGEGLKKGFDDAQNIGEQSGVKQQLLTKEGIPAFITEALKIFLGLIAIIAAAVIVYGGFLYITSAGDETKAEKAKKLILYAIVGLILIGVSALIVNIVIGIFRS